MKITPEVLKALGFEQQKNSNRILIDTWYLTARGYLFIIKGSRDYWEFITPGTYAPYSHSVTDVEELLAFTHKDAYEHGKDGFKKELRDFIGVKD